MFWLSLIAAVFAALTFFGWLLDKWQEQKIRLPDLVVKNDHSITDSDGHVYEIFTFTNTSDVAVVMASPPMIHGLSGIFQDKDHIMPTTVEPHKSFSVGFRQVDKDNAWILFGLFVRRENRRSVQFIFWDAIYRDSPMFEELDKQYDQKTPWLKRRLLGPLTLQHVGPGGRHSVVLKPRRSEKLNKATLRASLEAGYKIPREVLSMPRKLALGIWNVIARATGRPHEIVRIPESGQLGHQSSPDT